MSSKVPTIIILLASASLIVATPFLDFVPITEELVFTKGQSMGDSSCTDVIILYDTFVETQETFEVILLPNPNNIFGAFIQPGKDRSLILISDGEDFRSM